MRYKRVRHMTDIENGFTFDVLLSLHKWYFEKNWRGSCQLGGKSKGKSGVTYS